MRRRTTTTLGGLAAATLLVGLGLPGPALAAEEGQNVALGQPVTASGTEVDDGRWGPENVVDGDDGNGGADDNRASDASRWSSDKSDDAWIAVELAEPTLVHHVAIQWANACAAEYHLETSDDGEEWTDVTDTIRPTCGTRDVQVLELEDPVSHVKIQVEERTPVGGEKYGASLWELEVWDGPEPVAPVEPAPDMPAVSVIPEPADMTVDLEAAPFVVDSDTQVVAAGDAADSAELFAEGLRAATGFALDVLAEGEAEGAISFVHDEDSERGEEAYTLVADADGVTVTAGTHAGLYYGGQTLTQLLGPWATSPVVTNGPWEVPAVEIADEPRFPYRGHMIDPSRSFLTVEEVEQVIDKMSGYKLNKLHMHLTDDQGWRIAISNEDRVEGDDIDYDLLTEISGQTAVADTAHQPLTGDTGYYTQDDFRHIVAYAAERNIEIMPEIDAPAHINAALHAIPQLNSEGSYPAPDPETGTTPVNTTTSVGESSLDSANPYTYWFMEHVIQQIAGMNPEGDFFHLGGDESFNTTAQDYATFMERVLPFITDEGLRPVVWNEAARVDLPAGSVVQFWNGGQAAETRDHILNNDGAVIMSLASQAYLPQVPGPEIQGPTWACGGACGLDRFYNWDPLQNISGIPEASVLGVEAPLWNEHVRGVFDAEFMTYPRLMATAEVGWTPQELRTGDAEEFFERVGVHGIALTAQDTNFHPASQVDWFTSVAGVDQAIDEDEALAGTTVAYLAAPNTSVADVAATIEWADGETSDAALELERGTAYKVINSIYTISTDRTFDEAGAYEATVTTVGPDGERSDTFTVVVAQEEEPTPDPTEEPTEDPTVDPTEEPTDDPTVDPTEDPTVDPTEEPTDAPTVDPTPTMAPTEDPTTVEPTTGPTVDPTPTDGATTDDAGVGGDGQDGDGEGTGTGDQTGGGLPATGAASTGIVAAAVALLVIGALGMVLATRRVRQ